MDLKRPLCLSPSNIYPVKVKSNSEGLLDHSNLTHMQDFGDNYLFIPSMIFSTVSQPQTTFLLQTTSCRAQNVPKEMGFNTPFEIKSAFDFERSKKISYETLEIQMALSLSVFLSGRTLESNDRKPQLGKTVVAS